MAGKKKASRSHIVGLQMQIANLLQVLRFASSTKPGSTDDPESSNNDTPRPITKNLASSNATSVTSGPRSQKCKPPTTAENRRTATKRKSNPTIDPQHPMSTRSRTSRNDPCESPSPKRPRRGRARRHGPVIYSGQWHPMDEFLSPKRAAKVKATCGKSPEQSDTDDSGEEQESETQDTEEESSDDEEVSQASDHAPSPGCRRSSRKFSKGKVPNYDMRYVLFFLLIVVSGRHSIVDNMELDFILPLIRLYVQLLPGLR